MSKLSRIEGGKVGVSRADVEIMASLYRVDDPETIQELLSLAKATRERGWWAGYNPLNPPYVAFESEAHEVRQYAPMAMPSLLQTEDYSRALFRATRPDWSPTEVDRQIALRTMRRCRLELGQLRAWIILHEAALRTPYGGPGIMAAQLEWLLELVTYPNINMQVCEMETPNLPQAYGFTIIRLPELTTVCSEGVAGEVFLDEAVASGIIESFDKLMAYALSETSSVNLMRERLNEHLEKKR